MKIENYEEAVKIQNEINGLKNIKETMSEKYTVEKYILDIEKYSYVPIDILNIIPVQKIKDTIYESINMEISKLNKQFEAL